MSHGKPRLLLVDDDSVALALHTEWLRGAGFEVSTAGCGDDAVLLAREYPIDLVILDICMSGGSGLDAPRYFRKHSTSPFLFLSVARDGELAAAAEEHGALGYLVKPVEQSQLLKLVRQALAKTKSPAHTSEESNARPEHPHMRDVYLAAGVLMVLDRIDRDRAFTVLADRAREQRRALRDTAQDILDVVERVAAKPLQDFTPEVTRKLNPPTESELTEDLPMLTIEEHPNLAPDLDFAK